MPLVNLHNSDPFTDGRQSTKALLVREGVLRGFAETDWVFLPELTLPNGRRADLIGLNNKGEIQIIEIKSSISDFMVDEKWPEYRDFCDTFFFATHKEVPFEIFPADEGLILADAYGCEVMRPAASQKLAAATRKTVINRYARAAASRLQSLTDFV